MVNLRLKTHSIDEVLGIFLDGSPRVSGTPGPGFPLISESIRTPDDKTVTVGSFVLDFVVTPDVVYIVVPKKGVMRYSGDGEFSAVEMRLKQSTDEEYVRDELVRAYDREGAYYLEAARFDLSGASRFRSVFYYDKNAGEWIRHAFPDPFEKFQGAVASTAVTGAELAVSIRESFDKVAVFTFTPERVFVKK